MSVPSFPGLPNTLGTLYFPRGRWQLEGGQQLAGTTRNVAVGEMQRASAWALLKGLWPAAGVTHRPVVSCREGAELPPSLYQFPKAPALVLTRLRVFLGWG